jgi:centromere protein J
VVETTPEGVQVTRYSNGTVKRIHPDGQQEVLFLNGDTKRTHCSGMVVYYYANAQTTHTTYVDGSEVYEFPNSQVRCMAPDA